MSNVAPIRGADAVALTGRQITLIRDTVAKDCSPDEFNLFVEVCRGLRLDPFRRQVFPLVFSKGDKDKRRMTIVVSREGLRSIATRCGNYRPASEPAEIIYDEALKGPTNPKGIVLARVRLWKQDNRGDWYPVVGEAHWDEFAPIKEVADGYEWEDTGEFWPDTGKPKKRKKAIGEKRLALDDSGNWPRMPVVMITKCADCQALRAGWPEEFGGVYGEEEMDRARVIDMNASEIAEHEAEERRLKRIGGNDSVTVTWDVGFSLDPVPLDKFADRVIEHIRDKSPDDVAKFESTNAAPLREFWAKRPTDALELKRIMEKAVLR